MFLIPLSTMGKLLNLLISLPIKTLQKLDSNMPIFLTTEQNNELAQRLYIYLGFKKADFLDGDDLVFVYE